MRTQEIVYLALRKGEVTSREVVEELVDVKKRSDYRALLAQASTLLRRLQKRGVLDRKWVKRRRGEYVYSPSEDTINSLLPALSVLEERKRTQEISEVLNVFAKEIILELRMENEIKAIVANPSEYEMTENGLMTKALIVMSNNGKGREAVERKAKEAYGNVRITPVFIKPGRLTEFHEDTLETIYGWSFMASSRTETET